MANNMEFADFITNANLFIDNCRQLQKVSQQPPSSLDLDSIKVAAGKLAEVPNWFNKIAPVGGVSSTASGLVNAPGSKKTNDAAAALQKLFVGDDAFVR